MQEIRCLKFCNMITSGGQSPRSKFWGGLVPKVPPTPRDLRPWYGRLLSDIKNTTSCAIACMCMMYVCCLRFAMQSCGVRGEKRSQSIQMYQSVPSRWLDYAVAAAVAPMWLMTQYSWPGLSVAVFLSLIAYLIHLRALALSSQPVYL